MGFAPLIVMGISAAVTAYGQHKQAQAQANANKFNAQVADQNAALAHQNAVWQTEEGEQQVANSEMKTAAQLGGIKTFQAASGVDVNSGSAVDVENSARTIGKLDALTVRSNAARAAYGMQVEETSHKNEAILDRYAGSNAIKAGNMEQIETGLKFARQAMSYGSAGGIGQPHPEGSTMLGSPGSSGWFDFQRANATLS